MYKKAANKLAAVQKPKLMKSEKSIENNFFCLKTKCVQFLKFSVHLSNLVAAVIKFEWQSWVILRMCMFKR